MVAEQITITLKSMRPAPDLTGLGKALNGEVDEGDKSSSFDIDDAAASREVINKAIMEFLETPYTVIKVKTDFDQANRLVYLVLGQPEFMPEF